MTSDVVAHRPVRPNITPHHGRHVSSDLGQDAGPLEHQARDALHRARGLHDLRERMRRQVTAVRSSGSAAKLVDALFELPVMTIWRAQVVLDVTHRAASLNIAKLVDLGILTEIRHARRQRLFIASKVMAAVEQSDG